MIFLRAALFDGNFGEELQHHKIQATAASGKLPMVEFPIPNFGDDFTNVPTEGYAFAYENNNNYNKETVVRPIVSLAADVTRLTLTITAASVI